VVPGGASFGGPPPVPPVPPVDGEKDGETVLQGSIERITYRDERSLYTVLRLSLEEGTGHAAREVLFLSERVTAVGRPPEVSEGQRVRLVGRWTSHPQHGTQFEFDFLETLVPADEQGLIRYLSSPIFTGIGETLARRIVKKLGAGTLERIQHDEHALDGVRGLRPKIAVALRASVQSQADVHRSLAFLRGLGLGPVQAQVVLRDLGPACDALLREDPYRLVQVEGMGFLTDRIALQMGFATEDPRRLQAAIVHLLREASDEGHCALPIGLLAREARELLRSTVEPADLGAAIDVLERGDALVVERALVPLPDRFADEALVYLPWLHACERGVAKSLVRLQKEGDATPLASVHELEIAERAEGIDLHPDQRAAVLALLSTPVGLLSGGPGVGKTTIVRLITALAERAGCSVKLASPTGRAAKRLAEATGRAASTIHRLLRYRPGGGFEHDADHPLDVGLVILDEVSMLDVVLAHNVLKAIQAPTRVLLVGDPDQLPSVGAGNVLRDLIDSGSVPLSRLTHIWRQAEGSRIVENAHAIREGRLPSFPERGDRRSDFYFFPAEDPAVAAERVIEVVTERIPRNFGLDWTRDVQVIAPMYRGECGVDALNQRLREAQASPGHELVRGNERWRTGDRVIQARNDYEKEVFNGDMGRIASISPDGIVLVRFPEQDVAYSGGELSDLRPAFAITVHRSQGAEFPAVVMPLVPQHRMMLRRNLLYTAVTRAQKLVVLVGSLRALRMAIDDASEERRHSALAERLRQLVGD
jgi:exodeoxyribonuclease V alpha subunit